MVNATIPFLLNNMSYWIGQGVIGSGDNYGIGYMLIGAVIVITFLLFLWNSKLGMFGAIVILPPLLLILGQAGYIPSWLPIVMWIGLGLIIGWIMLEMWKENR